MLDQVRWNDGGPWVPVSVPHESGPPEHRDDDPLLPPGVGRAQSAAGIAVHLMRLARVLREGRTAPAVAGLDTCWNRP